MTHPEVLEVDDWDPLSVEAMAKAMSGAPFQWWIAGGWAIDLFLGRTTRAHGDLDVLILTSDQLAVQQHFAEWVLYKTRQSTPSGLAPWPTGEYLRPETGIHDVWGKDHVGGAWRFQLMFTEDIGDRWVFRRDRRIGGPLRTLGWETALGVPVIQPEIQLLYKARLSDRRPKDQADFEAAVKELDASARSWLADALRLQHGDEHDWLPCLIA